MGKKRRKTGIMDLACLSSMLVLLTLLEGVSTGARESRSMGGNSTPSDFICSYISSTAISWGLPLNASAQYCTRPSTRSLTIVGGLFCRRKGREREREFKK